MNKINYQKKLDEIINSIDLDCKPRLLLHSCCAPCSSYCLVYLRQWFDITCFYYNPNITDAEEYKVRVNELNKLVDILARSTISIEWDTNGNAILTENSIDNINRLGTVDMIEGNYEPDLFFEKVRNGNLSNEPEGGARCAMCFDTRLREAARIAEMGKYDYFTTSLTISPLKNANLINEIGYRISEENNRKAMWLPSDFKKKNGYKLSVELSEKFGLYRQNYCGCVYSMSK